MTFDAITGKISDRLAELSARERLMLTLGGVAAIVMICFMSWLFLSKKVELAHVRTTAKSKQLSELMALQSTYAKREMEGRQLQNKLRSNKIRIISHLETAAKNAGVEIGNMTPHDSNPDSDGIVETSVSLKLQRLSITRLQEFLTQVESGSQEMVFIKTLRVNKRFDDKSLLDAELTISTYKIS